MQRLLKLSINNNDATNADARASAAPSARDRQFVVFLGTERVDDGGFELAETNEQIDGPIVRRTVRFPRAPVRRSRATVPGRIRCSRWLWMITPARRTGHGRRLPIVRQRASARSAAAGAGRDRKAFFSQGRHAVGRSNAGRPLHGHGMRPESNRKGDQHGAACR